MSAQECPKCSEPRVGTNPDCAWCDAWGEGYRAGRRSMARSIARWARKRAKGDPETTRHGCITHTDCTWEGGIEVIASEAERRARGAS